MRTCISLLAAGLALTPFSLAQRSAARHTANKTQKVQVRVATQADMIFFHGVIYTGTGFSEDKPQIVEAMAVGGGKVLAVGKTESMMLLAGPHTRLRDLDTAHTGTFIFPGFNDAHTHLGGAGRTRLNIDLTGVKSLAAMLNTIGTAAKEAPEGHWLTGGNWDHTLWRKKSCPRGRISIRSPAVIPRFSIASTATSPSPTRQP